VGCSAGEIDRASQATIVPTPGAYSPLPLRSQSPMFRGGYHNRLQNSSPRETKKICLSTRTRSPAERYTPALGVLGTDMQRSNLHCSKVSYHRVALVYTVPRSFRAPVDRLFFSSLLD
jgi:hypothetical protein